MYTHLASSPVVSFASALSISGMFPAVTIPTWVVSAVLTGNQNSLISVTSSIPFMLIVTSAVSAFSTPVFSSVMLVSRWERLIEMIPWKLKLFNSSASDVPLWFASIHTSSLSKSSSAASICPSLFVSSSASASKPDAEVVPSFNVTLSPNSSPPFSILPLPSLSRARKPSSVSVHAIFSAYPLLSRSKFTPFSREWSFMPGSPRSIISGSLGGFMAAASL